MSLIPHLLALIGFIASCRKSYTGATRVPVRADIVTYRSVPLQRRFSSRGVLTRLVAQKSGGDGAPIVLRLIRETTVRNGPYAVNALSCDFEGLACFMTYDFEGLTFRITYDFEELQLRSGSRFGIICVQNKGIYSLCI